MDIVISIIFLFHHDNHLHIYLDFYDGRRQVRRNGKEDGDKKKRKKKGKKGKGKVMTKGKGKFEKAFS